MFSLAPARRVRSRVVVHADVAQLVERNLAKVEVASSSLVIRSERVVGLPIPVEWPRGEATDCKSVYEGSNPVLHLERSTRPRTPGRLAQR